jgi:exopolysaccharide biosynthesis WecB/TagA/CpsF family protein
MQPDTTRTAPSIAFFMQDFAGGGVEKMRLALAGAMAARGHAVFLAVARARGPLAGRVPPGVKIVDLSSQGFLTTIRRLRHFVRRETPDVLISSLDHNNVAALLCGLGLGTRTRIVICQHNALSQEGALGWKYRIIPALYRLLRRRADAIVAVSDGVANDLARAARIARDAITTIANPVVDSAWQPDMHAAPPHSWFIDRDRPVFVFAGRLVAQKDPLLLIEAFARRVASAPARLIVLGEGPLLDTMIQLAQARGVLAHIVFAGYVAQPQAWIAQADALLLTSRYEGFGNVIVEALACGTPVIAADCPHGPAEILAGGQFGHLVRPGDADAFARAMSGDVRARFDAQALRERGRRYTVDVCANAHEALIASLFARGRRHLFGIDLSPCSARQIVERLIGDTGGKLRLIVTPNLNHVRLLRGRDFLAACRFADIACPDGWPVALYGRLRGVAPPRRVTGCDILHQLILEPRAQNRRVVVVAETAATASRLRQWLTARHWAENWRVELAPPGLAANVAAQATLVQAIMAARPDILILTLGAPVSEVFIYRHRAALPPVWALCIGQAVRVEIGLVKRAPKFWRIAGLEWAWRCVQEPRRLGLRYAKDLAWFPWAVARDLWQSH